MITFKEYTEAPAVSFDFDDTIYSRDPKHKEISEANLVLLNTIAEYSKCVIVSGNDYETIHRKLVKRFGTELKVNFDIWADGGVVQYKNGKVIHRVGTHILEHADRIVEGLKVIGITDDMIFLRGDWPRQDFNKLTCIGIKPLSELEKTLLIHLMNSSFNVHSNSLMINNEARRVGLDGAERTARHRI